jgi:hypothetical protein
MSTQVASTTFSINAGVQGSVKGFVAKNVSLAPYAAVILPTSTNTFSYGTAVKIVEYAGAQYSSETFVEKAAANDDIFGFIPYDIRYASFGVGTAIAVQNTGVMTMESGAAITAGSYVEYAPTGDKVIPWAGTNAKIGRALESVAGSGFLIQIQIKL